MLVKGGHMNQEVLRERKEFLEEMMRELAERAGAFPEGSGTSAAVGKSSGTSESIR